MHCFSCIVVLIIVFINTKLGFSLTNEQKKHQQIKDIHSRCGLRHTFILSRFAANRTQELEPLPRIKFAHYTMQNGLIH